jgi:ABC-type lipoprotein export system ATPase subunit
MAGQLSDHRSTIAAEKHSHAAVMRNREAEIERRERAAADLHTEAKAHVDAVAELRGDLSQRLAAMRAIAEK